MEKPCVDNNQHFLAIKPTKCPSTDYHPTYFSNLATLVVIGAFVQFLQKARNPILIRSYP